MPEEAIRLTHEVIMMIVSLEKLIVVQPIKKFPAYKFILCP
jgi:hypothetical protein